MPTSAKQIRNDLIPLKAGIVRITPLDVNGDPEYVKAVTTQRNFLTSTQVTTSRTAETLANGNGGDKDYPTDEKFNLALVTNVFDPKFHNLVAGSLEEETAEPFLFDTTVTVPAESLYEVTLTRKPAKSGDGKYHFEIRDAFGNALKENSSTPQEGEYQYTDSGNKLTFNAASAGKSYSCVYYVDGSAAQAYRSNPVMVNPVFQVEVYGEMQSANYGGAPVLMMEKMLRATVSGDLPNATTQKSVSAPMTYNFASAPVPQGKSAFYQAFMADPGDAAAASVMSVKGK